MENQPSPHSAKTIARNISIGVITSVLAATVIYFLGYNRNEKADFNKKKEATIKVWGAYQENMRITYDLFDKLHNSIKDDDTAIVALRTAMTHEIEASLSAMENVKREPNADTRVYSTIDIKVQEFKDLLVLVNNYFDKMLAYAATKPTNDEGLAYVAKIGPEYIRQKAMIIERDSSRLAVYYEGLNKDYDLVLPQNK